MALLTTRWLVRLAVVRAIAIVLTRRMTQLEARLELLRRIRHMDLDELLDLKLRLAARDHEQAAPRRPDGTRYALGRRHFDDLRRRREAADRWEAKRAAPPSTTPT